VKVEMHVISCQQERLQQNGVPDWEAKGLVELLQLANENQLAFVTDDVQRITGTAGTTIAEWARNIVYV